MALSDRIRGGLSSAGVAAGPLFVSTFTLLGASRAGYDARRLPVSSLALGRTGWLQRANFVITGVVYLGAAAGLARAPGRITGSRATAALIAVAGAGLIGSGVFVTDPVDGFPGGQMTPARPARPSRSGTLHNLFALPIFVGIPAAALLSARGFAMRRHHAWAWYSAASGILMAVTFGLFGAAFAQAPRLAAWGGVIQRLSIAAGFGWLTMLFARARRGLAGRD